VSRSADRYPLESLLRLRGREADRAKQALARGEAERRKLETRVGEIRSTIAAIDRQLEAEERALDQRVDAGRVSVAELQLFEERRRSLAATRVQAAERLASAVDALAGAEAAANRLRGRLARAMSELRALERHHHRWRSSQRRRQRRQADEDVDPLLAHRGAARTRVDDDDNH
jgi:chromosome segregation ATPase